MSRLSASTCLILVGYVAMLAAVATTLAVARQHELASHSEIEQRKWDEWREQVEQQKELGDAPVERRVPKSTEPPTFVLLRDYFGTSMLIILVLSSAVYCAAAMMLRGAMSGPAFEPDLQDDP